MGPIVMLQMLASVTEEEEIVDSIIEALNKYKEGGYKEDDQPFAKLLTLLVKWQQKGDGDMMTSFMKAAKHEKVLKKVIAEEEKEEAVSMPLGKAGKA